MRAKFGNNPAAGQLRWVILLLAVAVILPTVCLLWFMTQAVKNERLAVRQKLIDLYQQELKETIGKFNQSVADELRTLDELLREKAKFEPIEALLELGYEGVVIYDPNGRRIYPLLSSEVVAPFNLQEYFGDAWDTEFVQRDYPDAIALYQKLQGSDNVYVRLSSALAKSRVLAKLAFESDHINKQERLKHLQAAIATCKELAFGDQDENCDAATLMLLANARLFLIELCQKAIEQLPQQQDDYEVLICQAYDRAYPWLFFQNAAGSYLHCDQQIFLAKKLLGIYTRTPSLKDRLIRTDIDRVEHMISFGERSIAAIDHLEPAEAAAWPLDYLRVIYTDEQDFYAVRHSFGKDELFLFCEGKVRDSLQFFADAFDPEQVRSLVVDSSNRAILGPERPQDKPFVSMDLAKTSPPWKAELYFAGGDVFESAARKQTTLYTWAGVLVIVLILLSGGVATQAIGKQIRLNRLKNDFIATVTHELKTPLSSMRVLVDTLLEGNYKGENTAIEYLQLISKENERLSHLIDNFLTFSRMERNKQAFEMDQVSPVEVANTAAEAMRTKFDGKGVWFDLKIKKPIPMIEADKDAMVTVLVNLLDNAYKYSGDNKHIQLGVSAQDGWVCFSVKDNGIGMTRRSMKRIFNRFYQADARLSRGAEGCGLGLSIVKFIVDAHKGKITVESKPDKGSRFAVRVPAKASSNGPGQ